jgi:hypothetical protein
LGARGGHCWQAQATPATASALPSEMAVDTTMSAHATTVVASGPAPTTAFTFLSAVVPARDPMSASAAAAARVAAAASNIPASSFLNAPRRLRCFSPKKVAAALSSALKDASPTRSMELVISPPPPPPRTSGPPHMCRGIDLTAEARQRAFEPFIDRMFSMGSMEDECIGRYFFPSDVASSFSSRIPLILSLRIVPCGVFGFCCLVLFSGIIDFGTNIARSTQCRCTCIRMEQCFRCNKCAALEHLIRGRLMSKGIAYQSDPNVLKSFRKTLLLVAQLQQRLQELECKAQTEDGKLLAALEKGLAGPCGGHFKRTPGLALFKMNIKLLINRSFFFS